MAKRRRKNKQKKTIIMFIVLILLAGIVCFLVWNSYFKEVAPVEDSTPAVQEEVRQAEKKEEKKEESAPVEDEPEEKKVVQFEGEDPNKAISLTGVVTYAGVNNGKITVRVNIDQFLNDGACRLKLKKNGIVIYREEAEIIDAASTSTCEGFDVNIAPEMSGKLGIEIELEADGKTGTINGEVEV